MSSTIAFTEALVATGIDDRDNTYWAGRATLVRRPEDHETYDRAFKVFWEGRQSVGRGRAGRGTGAHHARRRRRHGRRDRTTNPTPPRRPTRRRSSCASAPPRCCGTRTSPTTPDEELTEAQQLMTRLRLAGSPRESRRLAAQQGAHRPTRPAPHGSGGDEVERRAVPPPLARTDHPQPPARAPARRQRIDGAVRESVAAVRPCRGRRTPEGRGVRTRHPADAHHPRAVEPRPRHRPPPDLDAGRRLEWWYAPRRRAAAVQRCLGPTRHGAGCDRRHPLRRMGPRRPHRARRADGPAPPRRPPGRSG